jgi:hypothetical protein
LSLNFVPLIFSPYFCLIRHGHHDPDGPSDYLHTYARTLPPRGRREVLVSARPGRPERKALVAVTFAAVLLWPPYVRRGIYEKRPLRLWVVRVAEINRSRLHFLKSWPIPASRRCPP